MDVSQVSIAGRLQDPIQALKTALEAPVCAIGHLCRGVDDSRQSAKGGGDTAN